MKVAPKRTTLPTWWSGTRRRSSFSTRTTRFSWSLPRAAPGNVTKSVLSGSERIKVGPRLLQVSLDPAVGLEHGRQAQLFQRAGRTASVEPGGGDSLTPDQIVKPPSGALGLVSELRSDRDGEATAGIDVVQLTLCDGDGPHLLQGHRLRAKLDAVSAQAFPFRPLRLDRPHDLDAGLPPCLDPVGSPNESEPFGPNPYVRLDPYSIPETRAGVRDRIVEDAPLAREGVLREDALDVNQRALALAEGEVLDSREREKVVVAHGAPQAMEWSFTPAGRASALTLTSKSEKDRAGFAGSFCVRETRSNRRCAGAFPSGDSCSNTYRPRVLIRPRAADRSCSNMVLRASHSS